MLSGDMAKPLLTCQNADGDLSSPASVGTAIGILGSGDFARSLATRLVDSGFKVIVGSRNPKRSMNLFPSSAEVMPQSDAVKKAEVIFVAVFRDHYTTLCELTDLLVGKILVDVSNNTEINHHKESNAEYLASLFPQCTIVKGFNVISAWTLQCGPRDGNKQVLISCDKQEAKAAVGAIARTMGFVPVDMGSLCAAREIENVPLRLLPFWRIPFLLALSLFICFYIYNFIRSVLHPFLMEHKNKFYKIPIELVNVTLPCVAYVMLSLVYLPGVLAAFFQLYYGTKYRRFPDWLDQWLQHRKQIGLVSFFCAAMHAVYSLCLPMRRSSRYLLLNDAFKQITAGKDNAWVDEEVWRMEVYVSFGIIALGLLSLLAVTSLPSIGNALNWREFSFIQSKLGFAALLVSTLHTLTFGWRRAFDGTQYKFYLPPTYTLTLLVPCAIILAKVVLFMPCVSRKLLRIRRGWEKGKCAQFTLSNARNPSYEYSHGEGTSIV
ncbi:metalloreductase STEAP3 isoform X1 [Microcaecilia unicolor]|uniref:Metalloreductase STEAP3 isoform X1 n=1 Tax=Microcaecilia unicolor TaxID=1415580 RepID=A0A6P7YJS9_9AMPH|nr:metalloreductase STEAP3 isoform X1 [Microcaecilia unicolor]XP_030065224.1 metalloreductase STEAP3 isoform X1 [Microcaecilia unicolor]